MPEEIEEEIKERVAGEIVGLLHRIAQLNQNPVEPLEDRRALELLLIQKINLNFHLDFYEHEISPAGLRVLLEILPHCQITFLDLSGQGIKSGGVQAICRLLENPDCKLTSLYLSSNRITDEDIESLAPALTNSRLTSLDLSFNLIQFRGATILFETLANCRIASFKLEAYSSGSQDTITRQSAQALANILRDSSKSIRFDFSGHKLDDECVGILSEVLEENKNIIFGNFGDDRLNQIVDLNLRSADRIALQLIEDFSQNPPHYPSSQILSELLPRIKVVEYLLNKISGNKETFLKVANFVYEIAFDFMGVPTKPSSIISSFAKPEAYLSEDILKAAIASQQFKEEEQYCIAQFNDKKYPENWNKIPIAVLKSAVEKFVNQGSANQATSTTDANDTKRPKMENDFLTRNGRINFLIRNGIKNHRHYDQLGIPSEVTHATSSSAIGFSTTTTNNQNGRG